MAQKEPAKWNASHMPSQTGKIAIVTGANSGIGYPTAMELARRGAYVILACRDEKKGKEAEQQMMGELLMIPEAGRVEYRHLDVSSLASVAKFVEDFKKTYERLDLLVNNAGVMGETYAESIDGYELQFATNYLGHFALTAQLIDRLKQSKGARIVILSSMAHRSAQFDSAEIMTPASSYKEMPVYSRTKLYNMLFMRELNRRLQAKGVANVFATGAHPGFCATNIAASRVEKANWLQKIVMAILKASPLVQTPEMGALPTLYAATAPSVQPDDYFGPRGLFAIAGHPAKEQPAECCESADAARLLWEQSEKLARVQFAI